MAPTAPGHDRTLLAIGALVGVALLVAVVVLGVPSLDLLDDGDDRHEPNDDFLDATPLDRGTHEDLVLASGDRDVYAVELDADQTVTATLRFEHATGDLDLEAYDPDARILARSDSITDDESLTVTAAEPGRHYVLVYGHEDAGNEYALELESERSLAE